MCQKRDVFVAQGKVWGTWQAVSGFHFASWRRFAT